MYTERSAETTKRIGPVLIVLTLSDRIRCKFNTEKPHIVIKYSIIFRLLFNVMGLGYEIMSESSFE